MQVIARDRLNADALFDRAVMYFNLGEVRRVGSPSKLCEFFSSLLSLSSLPRYQLITTRIVNA